MAVQLSSEWGPYLNGTDARNRLCAFVDRSCGSGVGVAWAANGAIFPMRAPGRANGFGDVAVFHWSPPPPRRRPPPMDFMSRARRFIDRCMEQEMQAQMAEAQANTAAFQMIGRGVNRALTKHRDDFAGLVFDVVCVAASIALLPTGLGVIGLAGLVGGSFLLGADRIAYGMEVGGYDEGAEEFKKKTEGFRIAATIMTLPDLAFGGLRAVRELQEVRTLLAVDRTTARAAEAIGSRMSKADRAARCAQIAERANLRTQIRGKQIAASLKLEMAPRAAATGGTSMFLHEEVTNDESALHAIARQLTFHVTSVHK